MIRFKDKKMRWTAVLLTVVLLSVLGVRGTYYHNEKKKLQEEIRDLIYPAIENAVRVDIFDVDSGRPEKKIEDKSDVDDVVNMLERILLENCKPGLENRQYARTPNKHIWIKTDDSRTLSITVFDNRLIITSYRKEPKQEESIYIDLDFIGVDRLSQLVVKNT